MPGDLIKSAPLIISIPIPLVTYFIFPMALVLNLCCSKINNVIKDFAFDMVELT